MLYLVELTWKGLVEQFAFPYPVLSYLSAKHATYLPLESLTCIMRSNLLNLQVSWVIGMSRPQKASL